MTLASPSQSVPGTVITAAKINDPVNNIAAVVNGNIDDSNVSSISGSKIAAGSITTSALAGSAVTPAKWTNPYKFSAYTTTAYSFPNASLIKVPLDLEAYDTNNNYNTTLYRYIAPVNGYYSFSGAFSCFVLASTLMIASIYKNGVELARGNELPSRNSTSNATAVVAPPPLLLAAGDYVEFFGYQNQGATASLNALQFQTYFGGYLVSTT